MQSVACLRVVLLLWLLRLLRPPLPLPLLSRAISLRVTLTPRS